jgi:hypothetical protein
MRGKRRGTSISASRRLLLLCGDRVTVAEKLDSLVARLGDPQLSDGPALAASYPDNSSHVFSDKPLDFTVMRSLFHGWTLKSRRWVQCEVSVGRSPLALGRQSSGHWHAVTRRDPRMPFEGKKKITEQA